MVLLVAWLSLPTSIRWTEPPPGNSPVSFPLHLWSSSSHVPLTIGLVYVPAVYATSSVFANMYSGSIDTASAIIIAVGKPLMAKLSDVSVPLLVPIRP